MFDELYFPIRIGTIRKNQPVSFDIYVKVSDRFVHYFRENDLAEEDRIAKLTLKGVKKLFILCEAEELYLDYLDAGLQFSETMSQEDKAHLAHDCLTTAAENVKKAIENEKHFEKTKNQVTEISKYLISAKNATRELFEHTGVSQDLYQHSSHVSSLSISLAAKMGIQNQDILTDLGIAALLHDLSHESLDFNASIPRHKLSPSERIIYETHPQVSLDSVINKPYVSKRVQHLILHHEELAGGLGFPQKKDLLKLPIENQIFNLCDHFDEISIEKKISPLELMRNFFDEFSNYFDLNHIKALSEILEGH